MIKIKAISRLWLGFPCRKDIYSFVYLFILTKFQRNEQLYWFFNFYANEATGDGTKTRNWKYLKLYRITKDWMGFHELSEVKASPSSFSEKSRRPSVRSKSVSQSVFLLLQGIQRSRPKCGSYLHAPFILKRILSLFSPSGVHAGSTLRPRTLSFVAGKPGRMFRTFLVVGFSICSEPHTLRESSRTSASQPCSEIKTLLVHRVFNLTELFCQTKMEEEKMSVGSLEPEVRKKLALMLDRATCGWRQLAGAVSEHPRFRCRYPRHTHTHTRLILCC